MKSLKTYVFASLCMFLFTIPSKASHVVGGEITWECLSSGQYVFYMTVYRDCDAVDFQYDVQSLEIFNNPLPRNQFNQTISTISLMPDTNFWVLNGYGNTVPTCDTNNSVNGSLSCQRGASGAIQQFFYRSNPLTLRGVPPSSGWQFVWEAPCCRNTNIENYSASGPMILRAKMFSNSLNQNVDPCFDSSPKFRSLPTNLICRGYEFTYNHNAIDKDLDSLVYSWDRAYNPPASNPVPLPFKGGFSINQPTPNQNFDSSNIPSILNPTSGLIRTAVYSGVGNGIKSYITVIRVDAYRNGQIISSVFREMPYYFYDCPTLQNGQANQAPSVRIDGVERIAYTKEVAAGHKIRIPIQITDSDSTGYGMGSQKLTAVPSSIAFSQRFTDEFLCLILGIAPCATLENNAPILNQNVQPNRYELSGLGSISTELVWETGCNHLNQLNGGSERIYNFTFDTQDDHCPIPTYAAPTVTIIVKNKPALTEPILKGASVGLDGGLSYSWVPPIDSVNTFSRYESEYSLTNDGQVIGTWRELDSAIQTYQQSHQNAPFYFHLLDTTNQPDILAKRPNFDWYFRMKSHSNSCSLDSSSSFSEAVRVMEVSATPNGPSGDLRASARLEWNPPKPLSAATYNYFEYESPTHFYIWQNTSIEQNGVYIGGESVDSNWVIVGNTLDTAFTANSPTCNGERIGYRIEARDTVITRKRGTPLSQDSLDTLYFSTFSIIDTVLLTAPKASIQDFPQDSLSGPIGSDFDYSWINCATNQPIAGGNQSNFIPIDTGSYKLVVSLPNCEDTSSCLSVKQWPDRSVMIFGNDSLVSQADQVYYQWFDCRADTIIPGAINKDFRPADTGYYAVALRTYGIRDTSACFAMFAIGLKDISLSESIIVFPNPTSGIVQIKLPSEPLQLRILNIQGQLIEEQQLTANTEIDLAGPSGIYFLEFTNQQGERAFKKVVKQ